MAQGMDPGKIQGTVISPSKTLNLARALPVSIDMTKKSCEVLYDIRERWPRPYCQNLNTMFTHARVLVNNPTNPQRYP